MLLREEIYVYEYMCVYVCMCLRKTNTAQLLKCRPTLATKALQAEMAIHSIIVYLREKQQLCAT